MSVKPIEIKNTENGNVFTLEFNRDTVKFAEDHGFDIQGFSEGKAPMSGTSDLFYYAFRMHHPRVSRAETDKMLFEDMGGVPDGMVNRLIELYAEPFKVLTNSEDGEERKNSKLTVTF